MGKEDWELKRRIVSGEGLGVEKDEGEWGRRRVSGEGGW